MPEENLNQDQEAEKTNPEAGSESEEAEVDFEKLFDVEQPEEGETPEQKVARLEKTVTDLKKGMAKAFSQKGREEKSKQTETEKKEDKPNEKDDLSELFYNQTPDAELVESDLQAVADAKYNGSILKAWRNEKWLQEKANSISSAKKAEEENKQKIKQPSNGTAPQIQDISSVKAEDVEKLTPSQKNEWVKAQARKERESAE